MLSVQEAKGLLFNSIFPLRTVKIFTKDSIGYVLAEDIFSPVDVPLFNQSAMDGFAVGVHDQITSGENLSFRLTGESKAGGKPFPGLKKNTATSIYTGAAVPPNTLCVVMQEKATVSENLVIIPSSVITKNGNIRLKGSQIRKGDLAIVKGKIINPAAIGFICSMGIKSIRVFKKPVVSVLATGDELHMPGSGLQAGKIYESNSFMLHAALKQYGFETRKVKSVRDNEKLILENICHMLSKSNVVIISGGISVGKYDLVKDCLGKLNVKEIFYKVAQKPGKPFFAGKLKDKLIFAVPGNPAAALVCFYEYILPSLRKMSGVNNYQLENKMLPLAHPFDVKGDRDLFLRGIIENDRIKIPEAQESNILKSFAEANALVFIPAGTGRMETGQFVETHVIQ